MDGSRAGESRMNGMDGYDGLLGLEWMEWFIEGVHVHRMTWCY